MGFEDSLSEVGTGLLTWWAVRVAREYAGAAESRFARTASEKLSLFSKDSEHHKAEVGGTFAKTTHEVWKPFASKRDIESHRVAVRRQFRLQVASNSIQHLEFEPVVADATLGGVGQRAGEHRWVVRRDGGIGALCEEHAHEPQERGIHV